MDISLNQFIVELYRCGHRMPALAFFNKALVDLNVWLKYQSAWLIQLDSGKREGAYGSVKYFQGQSSPIDLAKVVSRLRQAPSLPSVIAKSTLLSHQHHQLQQDLSCLLGSSYLIFQGCDTEPKMLLLLLRESSKPFTDRDCAIAEWLLPHLCEASQFARSNNTQLHPNEQKALEQLPPASLELHLLTNRERQIASELAHGMSYKEVAKALHLSPSTVTNYANKIYQKLNVHSKSQLAHLYTVSTAG